MYNMKRLLLILTITVMGLASCKKEKTAKPSLIGFWKGKYGNTTNYPSSGYGFLFRKDGSVRVYNSVDTAASSKAEGTYTLTGSTINASYTYQNAFADTYSFTGTVNPSFTFLEGTWGAGTNNNNGGRYFVVKE